MPETRRDLSFPISDHPEPASGEEYVGQILGQRYKVESKIAEGAQGNVYEGTHVIIKRPVAIKILRFCVTGDKADLTRRFMNEGRAAGTLGHPNIVESLDMGFAADGTPYLVMELLQGKTLSDELLKIDQFSAERACHIARQIASGAGAAHARGIVHRDLKPHNVFLVRRDGRADHVKLLDFGISLFDLNDPQRGQIVGTADFMAPEQIKSPDDVDLRADVFALGAIVYNMLAGTPPFAQPQLQATLDAIVHQPAPSLAGLRPDLPADLVAVVHRALEKDPAKRFQSMRELEDALAPFEAGAAASQPPALAAEGRASTIRMSAAAVASPPAPPPAPLSSPLAVPASEAPTRRKPPVALLVAGGVALVALIGLAWALARSGPSTAQSTPAPSGSTALTAEPRPTTTPTQTAPAATEVAFSVTTPAPGGKVRFRGATHPLPFEANVKVGSGEPELVEVTAPGRQGRRYWVTLDRARTLKAELRFGYGTFDATPQENLVALGEEAPNALPTHDPRQAARKPAAGDTQPNAGASSSSTPLPVASASAAPTALPTPAPTPSASAAAMATTTATATAAATPIATPTVAPVATATGPAPGTIEPKQVGMTVRQHASEVRACFDRARMYNAELKGRVTVRAGVSASGSVTDAAVANSSASDPRLESCVVAAFKTWQFPPPTGGVAGTVTYTFVFE